MGMRSVTDAYFVKLLTALGYCVVGLLFLLCSSNK